MLQRTLRRLTLRLFLSHVLVAVLTGISVTAIILGFIWTSLQNVDLKLYQSVAVNYAVLWLAGTPDGQPNDDVYDPMPGWTLIVSPEDEIVWSRGETTCRAGMALTDCLSEAELSRDGFYQQQDEQWAAVTMPLVTGQRVIMQRGPITVEPSYYFGDFIINGYSDMLLFEVLSRAVMATPIALVLAWIITRPQIRRLSAVTKASQRFAAGDLDARINDSQPDDIGRLAQQFDDMAGALSQNIHALQALAQRNAELALAAEEAAIKAERARISRDLHDAIAQRLFSLSVSTTTLPDVIAQNSERGIVQARAVAELAEQTLLDLRGLLIDLRPNNLVQHGLAESLKLLFRQWQTLHQVQVEAALMLTGKHLPAPIEDTIYHITQEALSNIARHAHASLVEIALVQGQQQLTLSISDNGRGFNPDDQPSGAKFGLMSMRERTQLFGGSLLIESTPAHGTTIQARLPLISQPQIG